mgnify:CR=1 FL=1
MKTPTDYAASLALFLLDATGSIFGMWSGYLNADAQRELFGRFIGKGKIIINGADETIRNRVRVCFGTDYDDRSVTKWGAL